MINALILLAGGSGTRAKSKTPKQFVETKNGDPIFLYSIKPFIDFVDYIVVAANKEYIDYCKFVLHSQISAKKIVVVPGGNTGLESAFNAFKSLQKIEEKIDYVFIHDAARPFVDCTTIKNCLVSITNNNYCFSGAKMSESIFESDKNIIFRKDFLYKIMSPHCFRFSFMNNLYNQAIESNEKTIFDFMASLGFPIRIVNTEESNFKITTNNDLDYALKILNSDYKSHVL